MPAVKINTYKQTPYEFEKFAERLGSLEHAWTYARNGNEFEILTALGGKYKLQADTDEDGESVAMLLDIQLNFNKAR